MNPKFLLPFLAFVVVFPLLSVTTVAAETEGRSGVSSALGSISGEWMQLTAEGRHEEAYALARDWETRSREADDPRGLYLSLWRIAMYHSGLGNSRLGIAYYRECRDVLRRVREEVRITTLNEILLLSNLQSLYAGLGKLGELYLAQLEMEDMLSLQTRWSDLEDVRIIYDPENYDLISDRAAHSAGVVRLSKAKIRANRGDLLGAITLVRLTIDHYNDTDGVTDRTVNTYMLALFLKASWLVELGRYDEALEVWDALLADRGTYRSAAHYLRGLIRRSHQALQSGEAPEPLFERVYEALEELEERRTVGAVFDGYRVLALMYSYQGEPDRAFEILDEAIERARNSLDQIASLGYLLLARAEVGLAHGRFDLVEADLVEVLQHFRKLGLLRYEISAYTLYGEYLVGLEEFERAEGFLEVAESLAGRLEGAEDEVRLREAISALREGIRGAIPEEAVSVSFVDLQPVQMRTRVAPGERARGRFVLVNAGETSAAGELHVSGRLAGDFRHEERNTWVIGAEPESELQSIVRTVELAPREEMVILAESNAPEDDEHRLDIRWSGSSELAVWWVYSLDDDRAARVAVVNSSIAIDNPFYAIPLYHEIYYRGDREVIRENLRVVTGTPCRVIIFDAISGAVLAIDATGDGDFMGAGDVLFQDTDRTGFPDISIHSESGVAAIELLVFPDKELVRENAVEVDVQLLNRRGEWESQEVNIIMLADP